MKNRLLAFLLIICMALGSSAFASTDVDFSIMTNDELANLYARIMEELINRQMINQRLYAGKYIAGRDILVGRYVISPVEVYNGSDVMHVLVSQYNESEKRWANKEVFYLHNGEKCSIYLESGQELEIIYGEVEVLDYHP